MDHQDNPYFPIPIGILNKTVDCTMEFAFRLEIEAAALAGLDHPQAKALARQRLEEAGEVWAMYEYYASL